MKTWLGTIVIAYKTNPTRVLLIQNTKTGNITPISGAVEEGETLQQTAARELKEEVGWNVNPEQFKETPVKQEFIYGSKKAERAGDKGINQVFLLDAGSLPDPEETRDTKNPKWMGINEAKEKITFEDLKDVLEKTSELLPTSSSLESRG